MISCGDSIIGHPKRETLQRLKDADIDVFVTQQCNSAINDFDNAAVVGDDIILRSSDGGETFSIISGKTGAELAQFASKSEPPRAGSSGSASPTPNQARTEDVHETSATTTSSVWLAIVLTTGSALHRCLFE